MNKCNLKCARLKLPDGLDRASMVQCLAVLPNKRALARGEENRTRRKRSQKKKKKDGEKRTVFKRRSHLFSYCEVVDYIIVTPDHQIAALAQDCRGSRQVPCIPTIN